MAAQDHGGLGAAAVAALDTLGERIQYLGSSSEPRFPMHAGAMAATGMAVALWLTAIALLLRAVTGFTSTATTTEVYSHLPVDDGAGRVVGYMLEEDLDALRGSDRPGGGRVPVYDDPPGARIGYYVVGDGGGFVANHD